MQRGIGMAKIRLACITDIEEASRVLAKSWKSAYRGIVDDDYLDTLSYNHWIDFLATGLNNNGIIVLLMEDTQQIIGVAIVRKTENEGECCLVSFYLLSDKIGRGFGHAFYSGIENELINIGFSSCVLDVLENNARAIRFYKAHGFRVTHKEIHTTLADKNYICKVLEKTLQ
jgi:ribosomal protein S18 acetylase RimI-like enzyme